MGVRSANRLWRLRWRRFERHAGLSVAVPLCSLGLIFMIFVRIPPQEEPEPMQIVVEAAQPDEPPAPTPTPVVVPPPSDLAPSEVVATRVNSTEDGEFILTPESGSESTAPETAPTSEPASLSDWEPNAAEAAELAAMSRSATGESRALKEKQLQLKESITREEVKSAAKDFIANSDGATEGAIRLLNFEGFSPEELMPVLERYGFTYERRYIKASEGRGFLNVAANSQMTYTDGHRRGPLNATQDGGRTFSPEHSEGFYEVFVYSAKSISIMTTREIEALAKRGYDPQRSRVLKVVFGIVKREDGTLDLDVVEIQAEQVR